MNKFQHPPFQHGWNKLRTHNISSKDASRFSNKRGYNHQGIDLETDGERLIRAVADCVVADVRRQADGKGFGLQIWLKLKDDLYVQYAHLNRADVRVGQKVKAGQVIGLSGWSGNANKMRTKLTGSHLHFGVATKLWPGTGVTNYLDPEQFFEKGWIENE